MTKVLFQKADIYSVTGGLKQKLKEAFRTIPDSALEADPVAVSAKLIEEFSLNVPVIDQDKKHALTKETDVDVSQDPMRHILNRTRPFFVRGTEVRVVIPFEGDGWMFDVRPTMFTSNPPVAEIQKNELHFVYKLPSAGFDVDGDVGRRLSHLNQYLQSLRDSAEIFKAELQQLVSSFIEQRKRERGTHTQIVSSLRMPVRKEEPGPIRPIRPIQPGESKSAAKPEDEWDVFISHASEDKEAIATPLAEALRANGLRVWYDDFSLRLGVSLRESIDRGLTRSRYGVVILSGHFFSKHWPTQELNGLATREVGSQKLILPVWHGVGFAEVRGYSVTLADRMAVQTKDGLAHVVERIMAVVGEREVEQANKVIASGSNIKDTAKVLGQDERRKLADSVVVTLRTDTGQQRNYTVYIKNHSKEFEISIKRISLSSDGQRVGEPAFRPEGQNARCWDVAAGRDLPINFDAGEVVAKRLWLIADSPSMNAFHDTNLLLGHFRSKVRVEVLYEVLGIEKEYSETRKVQVDPINNVITGM
jgi:hypothetical protein